MSRFPARSFTRSFLLSFLFASTVLLSAQGGKTTGPEKWNQDKNEIEKDRVRERARWFLDGRIVPGKNAADLRHKALQKKMETRKLRSMRMAQSSAFGSLSATAPSGSPLSIASAGSYVSWTDLGPVPISKSNSVYGDNTGRITSIAIDQTDTTGNTVYVGGATGGVWKSTNAADAITDSILWTPLTDDQPSLSIGALSIKPGTGGNSAVILAGTGEPDNAIDSYYGVGVLHSADGGQTWSLISTANSGSISFKGQGFSKFAWSATNPNLVVAAVSTTPLGTNLGAGVGHGLFFSTDSGLTWTKGTNSTDGFFDDVTDVVYNAADDKFYAAIAFQGFYSSSNGQNWSRLPNQPASFAVNCSGSDVCDMRVGRLAVRSGRNEMYAWVVGKNGTDNRGIGRTTDGGNTAWTALTQTGIDTCGDSFGGCGTEQGFFDLYLAAVPNATNTDLYAGATNLFKCVNANSTSCDFSNVTHVYGDAPVGVHPDQHAIDYLHADPTTIFFGNDGGLYRVRDATNSPMTFANLNANLGSLTQYVSFSQHPTDNSVLLGGLQDNGSPARDTPHFGANEKVWVEVNFGDGGYNEIDPVNPALWYTANTDVSIQKCTAGDAVGGCIPAPFNTIVSNATLGNDEGAFYTPYILDPAQHTKLIVGTCRLWRVNNDGTGATALSVRFDRGTSGTCSSTNPNPSLNDGMIRSIAAGGSNAFGSSVIYVGRDGRGPNGIGTIWVNTNATNTVGTWTSATLGSSFPVSDIFVDHHDVTGRTAYATKMGFTGAGLHVWKTTNAGTNWTDISGDLPDIPVNAIVLDPDDLTRNTIYVGTDIGVFYTTNGGANWDEYGPSNGAGAFPNVIVSKLRTFSVGGKHKLRASTYGRGVWEADLASSIVLDYSIAISDSPQSSLLGQTSTFHGTVSFGNGYTGTITLSCGAGAPSTCTIIPNVITSSGTSFTVDVSDPSQGTFNFNVHATDGSLTHDAAVTFSSLKFNLGATPAVQSLIPGQSTTISVTNSADAGFADTITLDCSGALLNFMTCSNFNPNPMDPDGSSVLTITTTTATPLQNVTIPIRGRATSNLAVASFASAQIKMQNFTASAAPTTLQTVTNGNSQNFIANFAAVNGFNQSITVGCANLAAGMSCNAVPAMVTPGTPSTVTVSTANGATPLATTTFQIAGTALGVTRSSANLQLKTTDFSLSSTTVGNVLVNEAGSGTRSVQAKALNGFTGTVTLACAVVGAPTGVTCSVPASTTTSATGISFTTTVSATTAATAGNYSVTVTGTNTGQQRTYSFTAQVKDFTLGLGTGAITIPQPPAGQSVSVTVPVTLTSLNGFNGSTALSCTGQPVGITCAFSPASLIPTGGGITSTLTVTSASTVPINVYALQVKGTAGTLINQQPLSVTTGGQNFTQAVTPATQNVIAGAGADYTVVYAPLGGMNQPITVGCGLLPPGVTCTPNPAQVTPGVTPLNRSVVTLQTTFAATPAANSTIAILGTNAGLGITRSTNVTLSVKDFTVTANTAIVNTNVGTNITDTILVKGLNGFTGNVALGCVIVGTPVGTACNLSNLNPAATAAGTSVTATITSTAATTPAGPYTVQVTGTTAGGAKMVSFTVNIKDFTLVTGVGAITIPQPPTGQSSSLTVPVTLTALNGYNTSTSLSCTGQPAGVTCAFSPASGIPTVGGLHSTLTVTSTSTVLPNTYHLQVKATAGTLIRQQALDVTDYGPNFTQAVTPTTQNVTAGASAAYTVTYTPLGGMTQDITVSCGTLPPGVTCTPTPATVTPGVTPLNQSVVTLQTSFGITPGANSTIAILGASSAIGVTRSTNVTLSVKDFTVTANTAIVNTNVGTNITDIILVKGLNGFTGNVALGCVIVGAPAGMGCNLSNLNPAASAAGTSVTATITSTAATTPAGTYIVQVTGTNSAQSKMAQFTVNIKDFMLGTGTGAITIPQPPAGQSSTVTVPVTLTALNGFNTSTSLSCTGQPAGITCAFTPATGVPTIGGLHSTLTVTSTSTVLPNVYHLQVKATAGTLIRQQALDVIDYGPNFTQVVAPTTQSVVAGSSGAYTVTYTALGGMTLPIDVTCGALPAGATCTPNPPQVIPGTTLGNQSVVTLQTTFGTSLAANSVVAISGTNAGLGITRSNNVTLSVKDFSVTANTAIVATNIGTNITDTVLVKSLNGFTGNVGLSCVIVGAPAGANCTLSNLNPAAIAAGTSVIVTITSTAATTPAGSYTVQVTGTTGAGAHTAQFTVNIKDFTVAVSPDSQSIAHTGGPLNFTATLTALNGFTSSVTLSCLGPLPTGITCGFGPSNTTSLSVVPTALGINSNVRFTVANGTAANSYNLTVRGVSGTITRTQQVTVNVSP